MSRVLRYGKGKSSVEISAAQHDIIMDTLRAAEPSVIKVFEDVTAELAKRSEEKWLVRKKGSLGSKYMHRTGIRIIPPYTVEAFVENLAEYAWAIKIGEKSDTSIRQGKRLADVVLWSPARRSADTVAKKIADETIKRIK